MIISSVLFAFGVATSSVATLAWYNMNDIAAIGNLNLRVGIEQNAWLKLELEKNGERIIDEDDDGYTKEELGIEGKYLGQVSGMFESDWLNETTDLKEVVPHFRKHFRPRSNDKPIEASQDDEDSFYVQNEFYFKAGHDMTIYLSPECSIAPNKEKNEEAGARLGVDPNKLNNVVNAIRYSFLTDEGYIICKPSSVSKQTYYGGILDLDKDGYYDYNEDNKEILYGEYNSTPKYIDGEVEDLDPLKDNKNTFIANHAKGIQKVDFVDEDRTTFTDINGQHIEIKKEKSYALNSLRFDETNYLAGKLTPICHLEKGEEKRIIVSIYMEGWDEYMTDEIASASFDVNISFTGIID